MRRVFVTFGAALGTSALVIGASGVSGGCAYDWSFTSDAGTNDEELLESGFEDTSEPERDAVSPTEAAPPPPKSCAPPCSPGLYCKYPDHLCGRGASGSCTPIPKSCGAEPVCGCGNNFAKDPCSLANASPGIDVDVKGACNPETVDYFPCGYRFCLRKTEFCRVDLAPAGGTDEYKCLSFDGCSQASCTCPSIPSAAMNCSCKELDPLYEYRVECLPL